METTFKEFHFNMLQNSRKLQNLKLNKIDFEKKNKNARHRFPYQKNRNVKSN